ncbi:hypothetical protein ACLOJK_021713 [Asimina triloba]
MLSKCLQQGLSASFVCATITPKALIHQKYGTKACFKTEKVEVAVGNGCAGFGIPQPSQHLFRCSLELPEFSVTSETCIRKKDAEQSAAKIAVEKLGIQPVTSKPTLQEAWEKLVGRLPYLFTDETANELSGMVQCIPQWEGCFPSPSLVVFSGHYINLTHGLLLFHAKFLKKYQPLVGHFRAAVQREGDLRGFLPVSVIAACDTKISNLCKSINPTSESNPHLSLALILKAARHSGSLHTCEGKFGIWKQNPCSSDMIQPDSRESIHIKAIRIPCLMEMPVEMVTLSVASKEYYLDVIAQKLGVEDCSQVIISRTVSRASSEMRLYFSVPEDLFIAADSSLMDLSNMKEAANVQSLLNVRAYYFSGQKVYGDAFLMNVGYTWKSEDLFHEDVSLTTYYRMLISRVPDGNYKLSREATLAAELPNAFTTRSNWRGSFPRELLCMFCRLHRLSEPVFLTRNTNPSDTSSEISEIYKKSKQSELTDETEHPNSGTGDSNDGDQGGQGTFVCEVNVLTKEEDVVIQCYGGDPYRRQNDAIQSAALKVLTWLNMYFTELDMPIKKLSSLGNDHGVHFNAQVVSRVFEFCPDVHSVQKRSILRNCSSHGSSGSPNQLSVEDGTGISRLKIEGPETGISPSTGSLVCISYSISLVREGEYVGQPLESKDEFEFEIGACSVNQQLETCIIQMSVDQSAHFITELPSKDLILAASGDELAKPLSLLSLRVDFQPAIRVVSISICQSGGWDNVHTLVAFITFKFLQLHLKLVSVIGGCFLKYSVKLLRITEPLEDRMEQALFSPPLSKQRVEYALRHINESHAATLVDFGCGSGSLLDTLLEHPTALEEIVGVDISRKSLCRAAKILHSKLSADSHPKVQSKGIRSAILYDGSITDFDHRLYGFDIGTCLEVIEHMEEDKASLFGDIVLSSFCPRLLIVSTPNYEYNPVLQRIVLPNREDDLEDKSQMPSKFRNHDHKFEWTREQFNSWASNLASRHNYNVEFDGVGGTPGVEPGFASQIAVFRRNMIEADYMRKDVSHCYEVIWEWTSNRSTSSL